MIEIDKTDELYRYLTGLGAQDVDKLYLELANEGRFKRKDVSHYFRSTFDCSLTEDLNEKDLELVIDYFADLKKVKKLNKIKLNSMLKEYAESHNQALKQEIVSNKLLDVLYMCIDYKTLNKDEDLQDLVQNANIGLMEAVEHFNPKAHIDFDEYVIFWVRDNILKNKEKKND